MATEEWNETLSHLRQNLDAIEDNLKDTACRLSNIYNAIESGKFDLSDLALRIKELRLRQEQLLTEKRAIEARYAEHRYEILDPKDIAEYVKDLRGVLEEGQVCDRKTFIKGFVKEIRVKGDEVTVEYTPPLPEGQRETVLSIGCHGGR
jgi:hypothetical protein